MNHTHVVQAEAHLQAVTETREHLQALYADTRKRMEQSQRDRLGQQIAEAHQAIGVGLKLAHIHATLAVAERLPQLSAKAVIA
jgi:hypothetical protein